MPGTKTVTPLQACREIVVSFAVVFICCSSCISKSDKPAKPTEALSATPAADTPSTPAYPDQNQIFSDISQALANTPSCTRFYQLFRQNAMVALFSVGKDWNFAVFVPTDAAMDALPKKVKQSTTDSLAPRINKINLVNNHISTMSRNYAWTQGPTIGNTQLTLSGKELLFDKQKAKVLEIKTTPIGNQLIIIDKVLIKS